jgi:hypothetical protein
MNKADAKRIAETITREQLAAMFDKAKASITDWKKPSPVNPAISLGAAWNIYYPALVKGFSSIKLRPVKTNMVWVFGDYLPDELKPPKKDQRKSPAISVFHEEPIFEVNQ